MTCKFKSANPIIRNSIIQTFAYPDILFSPPRFTLQMNPYLVF